MASLEPAEEGIGSLGRAPLCSLPSLSMWRRLTPRDACFFVLVVTRPCSLQLWSSPPPAFQPIPPPAPRPPELYGRSLCRRSSLSPAASQPPTPLATAWVSQDGLKAEKVGRDGSHCSHVLSAALANWQQAARSRCLGGQRQARSPPAAHN